MLHSVRQERGTDAAVEYIASRLASGAIRSDEAEEIWKLLRASEAENISFLNYTLTEANDCANIIMAGKLGFA